MLDHGEDKGAGCECRRIVAAVAERSAGMSDRCSAVLVPEATAREEGLVAP